MSKINPKVTQSQEQRHPFVFITEAVVTKRHTELPIGHGGQTIGQKVDQLITDARANGEVLQTLTIELPDFFNEL